MRRKSVILALVVCSVLLPMWFVALHGEPPAAEIGIDHSVTEMRPLAGPVDAPTKLSPSQVGVIVWIALFALLAALTAAHRFMNRAVRPVDPDAPIIGSPSLPWIETEDRWIVEYWPASEDEEGIIAMGSLLLFAIAFAALFTGEYFTLARTQYFGVYAAGLFLSLAGMTVAYYAWFLPHVHVAERREH
jgi:hypothetical protein